MEFYHAHPFSALRTADRTYVEYDSGEKELYALPADPYQGHARFKGDDPTMRWIGRFVTDASRAVIASSLISARLATEEMLAGRMCWLLGAGPQFLNSTSVTSYVSPDLRGRAARPEELDFGREVRHSDHRDSAR